MRPSLSRFTTTSVVALIIVACASTASRWFSFGDRDATRNS
jgi:hypothetical protein